MSDTISTHVPEQCDANLADARRMRDYYSAQLNERTREWNGKREGVKNALISAYEEDNSCEDLVREVARILCIDLTVEKEFTFTINGSLLVTVDLLNGDSMPETWDLEQSFNVTHDEDNVSVDSWDVDVSDH